MIAYDGSVQSESLVADLYSAGLPDIADVLLITILEDLPPAEFSRFDVVERAKNAFRAPSLLGVVSHHRPDEDVLRESGAAAVTRMRRMFSEWNIEHRIINGAPVETLLAEAIVWQPDLILVGSHGRSLVGRFLLGSFSLEVASRALCSVRVSKIVSSNHKHKPRILMGSDSVDSVDHILKTVAGREWHDDTDVNILYTPQPELVKAVEKLRTFDPEIVTRPVAFDLGSELVNESKNWRSDAIFIADPHQNSPLISTVLGQTACPVEIVRNTRPKNAENLMKGELYTECPQ